MTPAAVNRLESGHDAERADCAILSLGAYLGIPWPEVLRAVTVIDKRHMGREGLTRRATVKIAAAFGVRIAAKRVIDWDEDYGLLFTPDHCAVLRNGLVMDRATVWEWADWLIDQKISASDCTLYVVKE